MGGPGTGRSYATGKINTKLNLTHLSSKELIKNEVSNGSQDVDVLHQTISRGDSVTNEVINNLVFEAIVEAADISNGFLIDGYPINQDQADSFCSNIATPDIVICLRVSNDRALQRLTLNDPSEEQRKHIDKRLEIWNTDTKPLAEKYNAVFVSAETKSQNEVICEIMQQIKLKTPVAY